LGRGPVLADRAARSVLPCYWSRGTLAWLPSLLEPFEQLSGLGGNGDYITSSSTTTTITTTGYVYSPPLNRGADKIIEIAGTNHINAFGTLHLPTTTIFSISRGNELLALIRQRKPGHL
jgi:hypothetical protein